MLINPVKHAKLHCLPIENYVFAVQQPSISLVAADVEKLAEMKIPIVLPVEINNTPALPLALLSESPDADSLDGYTPLLWKCYPFYLGEPVVSLNAEGEAITYHPLKAEPHTDHWSPSTGNALFGSKGQPSRFLKRTLTALEKQQEQVKNTQDLVGLLKKAGVLDLETVYITESGLRTYRILTDKLSNLEAIDPAFSLSAFYLATLIAESQTQLLSKLTAEPFIPSWLSAHPNFA